MSTQPDSSNTRSPQNRSSPDAAKRRAPSAEPASGTALHSNPRMLPASAATKHHTKTRPEEAAPSGEQSAKKEKKRQRTGLHFQFHFHHLSEQFCCVNFQADSPLTVQVTFRSQRCGLVSEEHILMTK